MNNDLISREALKKAFENTVCIEPMPYAFVKQIIDNAPTVDLMIARGHSGVVIPITRPHGKWIIDISEKDDYMTRRGWRCSACGTRQTYGKPNYCPTCGAQMDKGGEV